MSIRRGLLIAVQLWSVAVFGSAAPIAYGQELPAAVRELMRKAEAKEPEDGLCATVDWPASNRETNIAFKNRAAVGIRTLDKFNDGAICSSALVMEVDNDRGRRCVRYQWWACRRGQTCSNGTTYTCRTAKGDWEDQR